MILQQTLNEGSHHAGLGHMLKLHHHLIRGVYVTSSHGYPTSAAATLAPIQTVRLVHQLIGSCYLSMGMLGACI